MFEPFACVLKMSYIERDMKYMKYTNCLKIPKPSVSLVIRELMAAQLFISHCSSTSVKYFCGIKKQVCDVGEG